MRHVEEALAQYREMRHELKNAFFYIDELVKEGEYARLREYLDTSLCRQNSITDVVDTGRPIVSALLNQKKAFAHECGITMEIQAMLPGSLSVSDMALCTILSNLIDNAVRECSEIDQSQITVIMKPVKGYFLVAVNNTTRGNVLKSNPGMKTTKKDAASHGIGLKVVKSLVDECDGMMTIYMLSENCLAVECMLKDGGS